MNMIEYLILGALLITASSCSDSNNATPNSSGFAEASKAISRGDTITLAKLLSEDRTLVAQKSAWDQSTLLHMACTRRVPSEIIRDLIRYGSNLNAVDDIGKTPLHNAYEFGARSECINQLLEAGADPNIKDRAGKRPIEYKRDSQL